MASSKPSFTLAEADECVRLVRLARKAGWWKSVWQRVVDLDDLAEDLSWEAVSPNALAGSMTDGSKRLRDEGSASKMVTYAPAGSGHDVMKNVPMPSTGYPVGAPSPSVALPDGVPTVERWGQTLVSSGNLKMPRHMQSFSTPRMHPLRPIGTIVCPTSRVDLRV